MEDDGKARKECGKMQRAFVINNYKNIPGELKQMQQWVCSYEYSKVPMKAWRNEPASSINSDTWVDFYTALESVKQQYYDYCGFVFADNGYIGIDIDNGYDEYGFVNELGADIINKCKSYTEISKSGRGFHIITKGNIPFKGRNNNNGIEIYKAARYFIMTGNVFEYKDIVQNQEAIDYILEKYFVSDNILLENKKENRCKIYYPVWGNVARNGRISLRPHYPNIPKGSRNICLTSLAGMLHNQGYNRLQIYDELVYANNTACELPLDDRELQSTCNSMTRYKR